MYVNKWTLATAKKAARRRELIERGPRRPAPGPPKSNSSRLDTQKSYSGWPTIRRNQCEPTGRTQQSLEMGNSSAHRLGERYFFALTAIGRIAAFLRVLQERPMYHSTSSPRASRPRAKKYRDEARNFRDWVIRKYTKSHGRLQMREKRPLRGPRPEPAGPTLKTTSRPPDCSG